MPHPAHGADHLAGDARSPAPTARTHHALRSISLTLLVSGLAVVLTTLVRPPAAHAAQPAVGLGTATPYAVMAGQTVTNTGPSVISGDLGVSPGTAVTGFPPGLVQAGTIHAADATALQAQGDLTTAYLDAAGRGPVVDQTDKNLGGQTLVAGVQHAATGLSLTGTLTLDAQGDPAAVFILQAGSTLVTSSGSGVALVGGAQACNVFWQVGSSATIGTSTSFVGTVMALTSITVQTGATIRGRLLARNGSVTLDTNTITRPSCAALPTTDGPTDSPTDVPTSTTTATPTATPTTAPPTQTVPPADPGSPGPPGLPPGATGPPTPDRPRTPWVPQGHPPTGRTPGYGMPDPTGAPGEATWLGFGLIALGGLAGVAGRTRREHLPRP